MINLRIINGSIFLLASFAAAVNGEYNSSLISLAAAAGWIGWWMEERGFWNG